MLNISKNVDFVDEAQIVNYYGDVEQCYEVHYYSNGSVECEGWSIYRSEDFVADGAEVGVWKYYQEDGTFSHEIDHSAKLLTRDSLICK